MIVFVVRILIIVAKGEEQRPEPQMSLPAREEEKNIVYTELVRWRRDYLGKHVRVALPILCGKRNRKHFSSGFCNVLHWIKTA